MNDLLKPCLVDTGQGFSVLYRDRYLYSRHSPARAVTTAASGFDILPETLVICFSPLLGYGLSELLSRLPDTGFILGIEADKELSTIPFTPCLLG